MKTTVTLIGGLVLLLPTWSQAETPRLLLDAHALHLTRLQRVQAEISLAQFKFDAKSHLQSIGAAAPLELDTARNELRSLQYLEQAILNHGSFLESLWEGLAEQRQQHIAAKDVRGSSEYSRQIRINQGRLDALQAEIDYLQQLGKQLRAVGAADQASLQEIQLTELKCDVARKRLAMCRAAQFYEASLVDALENQSGESVSIAFDQHQITGAEQLAAVVDLAWQVQKLQAEQNAAQATLGFVTKYKRIIKKLNAAGMAAPGELASLTESIHSLQIRSLDAAEQLKSLNNKLNALLTSEKSASILSRHRFLNRDWAVSGDYHGSVSPLRNRVVELSAVVEHEPFFLEELNQTKQKLALAEASAELVQISTKRSAVAQHIAEQRQFRVVSSPSRQPHDQIANFLRVVCAEAEAAQHFSQLRISHAQFKLNALEELENLGSASKMEVARAARDLSIAKAASLEAAEVQTLARQELSRLKAPVESDSSPNYATVLLNR